MGLQESGEMYLETVLILSKSHSPVRATDIAEYMGYSKPSISRAIGLLRSAGLIAAGHGGALTLTAAGLEIAEKTYERHILLTEFFVRLGVSHETASRDACKIEHSISSETFEALKSHASAYEGNSSQP